MKKIRLFVQSQYYVILQISVFIEGVLLWIQVWKNDSVLFFARWLLHLLWQFLQAHSLGVTASAVLPIFLSFYLKSPQLRSDTCIHTFCTQESWVIWWRSHCFDGLIGLNCCVVMHCASFSAYYLNTSEQYRSNRSFWSHISNSSMTIKPLLHFWFRFFLSFFITKCCREESGKFIAAFLSEILFLLSRCDTFVNAWWCWELFFSLQLYGPSHWDWRSVITFIYYLLFCSIY